jgi:hypothetical protein
MTSGTLEKFGRHPFAPLAQMEIEKFPSGFFASVDSERRFDHSYDYKARLKTVPLTGFAIFSSPAINEKPSDGALAAVPEYSTEQTLTNEVQPTWLPGSIDSIFHCRSQCKFHSPIPEMIPFVNASTSSLQTSGIALCVRSHIPERRFLI